jgi:hypothetical protein
LNFHDWLKFWINLAKGGELPPSRVAEELPCPEEPADVDVEVDSDVALPDALRDPTEVEPAPLVVLDMDEVWPAGELEDPGAPDEPELPQPPTTTSAKSARAARDQLGMGSRLRGKREPARKGDRRTRCEHAPLGWNFVGRVDTGR